MVPHRNLGPSPPSAAPLPAPLSTWPCAQCTPSCSSPSPGGLSRPISAPSLSPVEKKYMMSFCTDLERVTGDHWVLFLSFVMYYALLHSQLFLSFVMYYALLYSELFLSFVMYFALLHSELTFERKTSLVYIIPLLELCTF